MKTNKISNSRFLNNKNPGEIKIRNRFSETLKIKEEMELERKRRKKAEIALKSAFKKIRSQSSRLILEREKEKKKLAQELHDNLGSSLTALKFGIEKLMNPETDNPEKDQRNLKRLYQIVTNMMDEVQRIQNDLRPIFLDVLGLKAAIEALCEEFQQIYSIQIDDHILFEEENISAELKITIFRIIQEALNNVAKHSKASLVILLLQIKNQKMELQIRDNGVGFINTGIHNSSIFSNGMGLIGMRERVEESGGTLLIQTQKYSGTIIRALWGLSK